MPEEITPTHRTTKEAAMHWLLGQPAIVICLVAIIVGGGFGVRWVATDVVPLHFSKMREIVTDLETSHREEREKEATASREERRQAQQFHVETIDRIERLATGRKTTAVTPLSDQ